MAGLGQNGFDSAGIDPVKAFEPVPTGDYVMAVVNSDVRATSSGNGSGANFEIEIIDGPHKGRKIFKWINLTHPKEVVVNIGKREMAGLLLACGKPLIMDTCELHNIPFIGKVVARKRKGSDEWENNIAEFAPKTAQSSAPQQQAGGAAPWQR